MNGQPSVTVWHGSIGIQGCLPETEVRAHTAQDALEGIIECLSAAGHSLTRTARHALATDHFVSLTNETRRETDVGPFVSGSWYARIDLVQENPNLWSIQARTAEGLQWEVTERSWEQAVSTMMADYDVALSPEGIAQLIDGIPLPVNDGTWDDPSRPSPWPTDMILTLVPQIDLDIN